MVVRSARRRAVIRDPVHGDIHLTGEELGLLDTAQMQRLRGIRQLGTAYLVFPGAQHTRFEHSLGTLHLLGRMVEAINRNRELAPLERIGVPDEEARILRAAALVHDVTHIPFGHNIEDQSGLLERHDSASRFGAALGADTELGARLDDMGIREEVLATLLPAGEPGVPTVPHYWRELLSDTICPDILDYLRRDAYFTGLNLFYDDRVMDYFMVDRASGHLYVDATKRGLVREDILSELVRVLEARYFFSERVYHHHAKVAAGAMLAHAVATSLAHGGLEPEQLHASTDDSLLALLTRHAPPEACMAERHADLLARFRSRRLLKRACVFPLYANRKAQAVLVDRFFAAGRHAQRTEFEAEVRLRVEDDMRAVRMSPEAAPSIVLFYCPAREMQLKEAQTHVLLPEAQTPLPLARHRQRIPRMAELERAYRDLWKLYVLVATDSPVVLERVATAVAGLLPEATNVYQPIGH